MDLDQALQTFIVESRELLEEMESSLLSFDKVESQEETINAIFRAAHTIKGSAGLFGLNQVVSFTHKVESVLDDVRSEKIKIDNKLIDLLLACGDHIGALIDIIASGDLDENEELTKQGIPLLGRLQVYLSTTSIESDKTSVASTNAEENVERIDASLAEADYWHISLRFGENVLRNGMDPMSFIRYLTRLGSIVGIVTLSDAIPDADQMDAESCYLGFEITFMSDASKATIEEVFEFVRDDCEIRILPPNSKTSDYIKIIQELPEEMAKLGEILVKSGIITESELNAALSLQKESDHPEPIGQIIIEKGMAQPSVVEAALAKQTKVKEIKSQESKSIRVDSDKLDNLINLIGELIIAAASTELAARRARNAELQDSTSTLSALVEKVRDSALELRMVKIGATFGRFQRVVRDVAQEIGKDIELIVDGEDTELDKTVVEKITDPLTHLVRNAVDHGIEMAEVRIAAGKPARGAIRLNAYHDSGSIVIEVGDDGGGLKRDKILAKAIEVGIIEPGQHLSDNEIYGLIFEPGFSTADQITNLSGRGVGMDVVKKNITALRGTVDITSEQGVGTTVSVRLPLTLAIIDGFLVGLGNAMFVIPLDMIDECVEFPENSTQNYTPLRGTVLPFIRLAEVFEMPHDPNIRKNIVVVKHAGQRAGVVVDSLLGEFQTVIKPLGKMFQNIKSISGSTILGSGEVALILDVPSLVQHACAIETRGRTIKNMEGGLLTAHMASRQT